MPDSQKDLRSPTAKAEMAHLDSENFINERREKFLHMSATGNFFRENNLLHISGSD